MIRLIPVALWAVLWAALTALYYAASGDLAFAGLLSAAMIWGALRSTR